MLDVIDRVECFALEVPLNQTFRGSTYDVASRCTIVTRIHSKDGVTAQVYNGDPRSEAAEIVSIVTETLGPRVAGRDPLAVIDLWTELGELTHRTRDRRTLMAAISSMDCAIWDLRARLLGVSVGRLLGTEKRMVPVIAIGGYYHSGDSSVAIGEEMAWLREQGVRGCKMKVGGLDPEDDAKRVREAREGGGPDFVLAVDANRAWTIDQARRFAHLIEDFDIAWFEEPCQWHSDAAAMAAVARGVRIPLCAGQSEIGHHGVLRLLQAGGVDIVNFDVSEGGGVTAWQRSAVAAEMFGARVGHHEEPQIAAQLLAACSGATYVEVFPDVERDPIWAHLLKEGPTVRDGSLLLPDGAGFGLEFDEEFVQRYRC